VSAEDVAALIGRSHRLGSDPRTTNYGGGNTSCKTLETDPVTGKACEVLFVKGSGGDLGTLSETGLAALRLDRLRDLVGAYPGPDREDEMVARFDHCRFGAGGAAPSIDTAMHGLVDMDHVDHLHPDAVIALATAADGEALTRECFGDRLAWVPWRRPGFELGLDIAALQASHPAAVGCVLGGHGLTTWGPTSEECERRSMESIGLAERFIAARGRPDPFGATLTGYGPLPVAERHALAAELAPQIRGLASTDRPVVGCYHDSEVVLRFLSRAEHARLARLGSSCPDHFLRTKVSPLVLDLPATAAPEALVARLRELHASYRDEYRAYYARHATPASPPMRGADPTIFLVPGVGMFSYGRDALNARVAGEFFVNAINAMAGAEALSTYRPIPEGEKFRIEYWELEEAKLRRAPAPRELESKVALVTGAASGIGRATARRLASLGAAVVVADLDSAGAEQVQTELRETHGRDSALALPLDVTDEAAVAGALAAAARAYGGVDVLVSSAGIASSAALTETSLTEWERNFSVLATGYFLVAREGFKVMRSQGLGGSVVFVASKNAVVAGKNASAYSAAKAAELHLARCLAEEGAADGIRVNTVNPDAVLAGSAIWSSSWRAERAAAYGIAEEELEDFYRARNTLHVSVRPEDVAEAIAFFAGPRSTRTTGNFLNVDGGVTAAYPR
jgi:rhamnulose-1-phosphate aldolase/alcohol dehydrogenase